MNPAKIKAVQSFFEHALSHEFSVIGIKAEGGVRDQPLSEKETAQGAHNRCVACFDQEPSLDLAVGLEWWVCF